LLVNLGLSRHYRYGIANLPEVIEKLLLFVPLALALIRAVYATEGEVDPSSMVAAHNKWRSEVGVSDIKWSETLAQTAQAWADNLKRKGCVLEHSKDSGYGENLYWTGPVTWSDGRTEVQSITPQKVSL
jgi:pathogenesis-related protein 1